MDILWLKDFEALVAQKNFSRAAEDRHVSQPAFSRRIRALEDEVGVPLINRQTLPLSLTPAGEVFLSQAKLILRTYEETLERCHTIDAVKENLVRFATSQSLYLTHYKTHLAPLVEAGGIDIDLNSTSWSADQFVTALQQKYCDVILTYWHPSMDFLAPLEVSGCRHVTLSKDRFLLVSRADKNGKAEFSLDQKTKEATPLLSYSTASALRSVMEHVLNQQLQAPNVLVVNQNTLAASVKALIMEGFGLGWLPGELCKLELAEKHLALVDDDRFSQELEIRLYCERDNTKPILTKLWTTIESCLADTPDQT